MGTIIRRGDIFYADLNPVVGSEMGGIIPVVIIQNDIGNRYSSTVIVAAITSSINKVKLPTHVEIPSDEDGVIRNSVILLEQMRTLDKRRLKEKISMVSSKILKNIDKALSVVFSIRNVVHMNDYDIEMYKRAIEKYKKEIFKLTKPLVLTEGKTDVKLIEVAWRKLYPSEEMFFECKASGININEEKREGSADSVRRALEYLSTIVDRPVIGIFDNDRAGNEQFKGLNKKIFEEYNIKKDLRKHKANNVWGMLLPVPNKREIFVTEDDITQRYLVIEHYFSDEILKKYEMYGSNILGTCVFKVNSKKNKFSDEVNDLGEREFENFRILFSKIRTIFNIE